MAARKNRPVLYELVQRSARQRGTSQRPTTPTSQPASSPATAPNPRSSEPAAAPSPASRDLYALPSETRGGGRSPSPLHVAEGRVTITLGWPGGLAVGVGLILLLLVAYDAGRRTAGGGDEPPVKTETNPATPAGAAPAPPATPDGPVPGTLPPTEREVKVPAPAEPKPKTPPAVDPATSSRDALKDGYHYVVVQFFPRSKPRDAEAAAEFLRENRIPCTIRRGPDLRLVVTEPFLLDQDDRSAANAERRRLEQLKDRIRGLGQVFKDLRGYDFAGCQEYKF